MRGNQQIHRTHHVLNVLVHCDDTRGADNQKDDLKSAQMVNSYRVRGCTRTAGQLDIVPLFHSELGSEDRRPTDTQHPAENTAEHLKASIAGFTKM